MFEGHVGQESQGDIGPGGRARSVGAGGVGGGGASSSSQGVLLGLSAVTRVNVHGSAGLSFKLYGSRMERTHNALVDAPPGCDLAGAGDRDRFLRPSSGHQLGIGRP